MTASDAAIQMDLLGRDFFVFVNEDTGRGVVYRRKTARTAWLTQTIMSIRASRRRSVVKLSYHQGGYLWKGSEGAKRGGP